MVVIVCLNGMSDTKYQAIGSIEDRVVEECSEVIQAICKAQRFGILNFHPETKRQNVYQIADEIQDLERVLEEYRKVLLLKICEAQKVTVTSTNQRPGGEKNDS